MPITLVKSGTLATASTTTITPTFGQATTAGNLLVAQVATDPSASGSPSTSSSGWAIVPNSASGAGTGIYYKKNCGTSETAPTFTLIGVSTMWAVLTEWNGADTIAPIDQVLENGNPGITTCGTNIPDNTIFDICLIAIGISNTKSATATFTNSWNVSGTASSLDSGTTKNSSWGLFPRIIITNGGTSADTDTVTVTPSTGVATINAYSAVSFKVALPNHQPYVITKQTVNRASLF